MSDACCSLRAPGLRGARAASLDAAQGAAGPDDEERLTADIVALARQYGRYGYRRITAMLRACRLAGERQAGRADLAAGGAEGPARSSPSGAGCG